MRVLKQLPRILIAGFLLLVPALSTAGPLKVVTTVPDLAWLVQELGGNRVEVKSLCKGYQDPHYLEAKPSFARDLRKADLLVFVGLELEVAWLPRLLETARNPLLRSGSVSLLNASAVVQRILEVPSGEINRGEGDIHPHGNPHYLLDPRNMLLLSRQVSDRLIVLDSEGAAKYQDRLTRFKKDMEKRLEVWSTRGAQLSGTRVVAYHKQWEYLTDWLGIEILGYVENRPGVPSSPRHINNLVRNVKQSTASALIAAPFVDVKAARSVAEKGGLPFLILPAAVGGTPEADSYPRFIDGLLNALIEVQSPEGGS